MLHALRKLCFSARGPVARGTMLQRPHAAVVKWKVRLFRKLLSLKVSVFGVFHLNSLVTTF